jgi:hypothetical protein
MLAETTQTLERFAFEGPLTATQGVVLGCVLAALAFCSLFVLPKVAPRRFAWLLWTLRVGAIAILIWMLIGPVNVTILKHQTPKSLAVIADVSESMNVYDPADNKANAHWQAIEQESPVCLALAACDRAAVAAATARDNVERALTATERHEPRRRLRRHLELASRAVTEAERQSLELCRLLEDGQESLDAEFLPRAREIANGVGEKMESGLADIAKGLPNESAALGRNEQGQLEGWQQQLSHTARSLAGLADRIAGKLVAGSENGSGADASAAKSLARRERVERLLADGNNWLAQHDESARICRYSFDREMMAASETAPDNADSGKDATKNAAGVAPRSSFTNLSSALERIGRDAGPEQIEAVVMLTDGRHNDPAARDPRDVAKLLGNVPFHIVPVGISEMPKDLILHHVEVPTAVVENDQVVVEAILSAFSCEGETAVIELTEGETVVDHQEIEIASVRRDYHLRLSAMPKGIGRHEYALTVNDVAGETIPTNNSESFGVDVVDAKLRILLADGFPRWEYRYLVNLFERSERVEYEQLLFHPSRRASGQLAHGVQLPRDVDAWANYRLAIIGDLEPAQFDEPTQRAMKDWVTLRGGTVIIVAGSQAMPQAFAGMPLADLIPVTASDSIDPSHGFQLELSAEGKLNSAMQIADETGMSEQVWKDVSRQLPVYSLSQYCAPKPTARTLIHAVRNADSSQTAEDQKAFLCWQTVGRGRIVYLAAPTVYQLRMKYGDRYHHKFWGQLIRWAVARDLSQGSKTVKLAAERSRVAVGDNLQVVANLSTTDGRPVLDAEMSAEAKLDGISAALVQFKADPNIPGRYLGDYAPTAAGTLTLQAFGTDVTQLLAAEGYSQAVETSVVVDPMPSTETEDTRTNTPLLRQIARLTGGQIVQPAAVEEIVALTDLEPRVEEQTLRSPLWNRWIYLWLISGLLTVEWAVRKSTGRP